MKLDRTFKIATLTALSLAAASGAANADGGTTYLNAAGPDPIVVVSNGQDYTQIKQHGMFSMNVTLTYDTGVAGRIKSYWIEPYLENGWGIASPVPGMAASRQTKSYPVGSRPKSINKQIVLSVLLTTMKNNVVGMCNMLASKLRSDGLGNDQIFGQDREVSLKWNVKWNVDASGAGSNNPIIEYTADKTVKVICQKWQGAQIPAGPQALAPAAKVEHATLLVKPQPTLNGQCKVKLTGMVRLNRANYPVKVRFEHTSGSKSEVMSFNTAGNMIGLVNRVVDIPQVAGAETGAFRMVVIEPDGGTGYRHYSMNCADIGGLTAQPSTPPVGSRDLKPADQQGAPRSGLRLQRRSD